MARIERAEPQVKAPVKQAVLIDPNAFKFTGAGEGLKVIGGVLKELGKRKIEMQDRIGISNINASMENAEREYQKEIINKPLEEHAAILMKHRNNAMTIAGQERLSGDARKLAENKLQIWGDNFSDIAEIATIKVIERDAVIRVTADYEKALTEGDAEDIVEAETFLDAQYKSSYEPAEAKVLKEKTEQRAVKQMEDNAIRFQKEKAVIAPQKTNGEITAEIDARKKGKKPSGEFALISNEDLESIRDYSKTIGEKQKTQSEINFNASLVDAYSQIRDNDAIDIDVLVDKNNLDPNQSNEDKVKFAEKIPTYFNKINSTITAEESNEEVYDELTQMSEAVERGSKSPSEFEETYADKKHLLTRADQRDIRSRDIVATKTMQNRTFSDALSVTRPILVELTESELGSLKLARQNAELIKDIPSVNFFNIALKKNQAEQWNMGRFRKELRSQIAQNPEWSQKQIFVAQEVLADKLDLPVGELLKSFDAQNPNSAIMTEPPDNTLKDIWPGLDFDDRAKIWELKMRGAPTDVILLELNR